MNLSLISNSDKTHFNYVERERRCYQADCIQEKYRIINEYTESRSYKDYFHLHFEIHLPAVEETVIVFIPKLELVEFLVYVGGTIGFWFGSSIIDLYVYFLLGLGQTKKMFNTYFHQPVQR